MYNINLVIMVGVFVMVIISGGDSKFFVSRRKNTINKIKNIYNNKKTHVLVSLLKSVQGLEEYIDRFIGN